MAPWLLQALRTVAYFVAGGAAFEGGQRMLPGGGGVDYTGEGSDWFGKVTGIARPEGRRRRRRRALTASDRADIAFVAGMISKAAAKDFAVQLAARPR